MYTFFDEFVPSFVGEYFAGLTESNSQNSINSLAPRSFELNFKQSIFKLILVIGGCGISCEIFLR